LAEESFFGNLSKLTGKRGEGKTALAETRAPFSKENCLHHVAMSILARLLKPANAMKFAMGIGVP
jgi:hypothetical protein